MEKRKARVLIADDEPHIRNVLKLILSTLGAEVVGEAGDGESAVALFSSLAPDMVMLDINMPKQDGVKTLKQIMSLNSKTLVVMMTAQNTIDVVNECFDIGARNFILKSNTAEELLKIMSETWVDYMAEIHAARQT